VGAVPKKRGNGYFSSSEGSAPNTIKKRGGLLNYSGKIDVRWGVLRRIEVPVPEN